MENLNENQKKRLLKLAEVLDGGTIALLKQFLDSEEAMSARLDNVEKKADQALAVAEETQKMEGPEGYTPVKGTDYEDGKNYVLTEDDKSEIAKRVEVPVVEKIVERTEVIRETPTVTEIHNTVNEIKEVAVPDTAEATRDKLTSLEGDERLDISAIKGVKELEDNLDERIKTIPRGSVGGATRGVQLLVGSAKKGLANYINFIAGAGITLTHTPSNGRNDITISSSLGGSETPPEIVDGSNKMFTFQVSPKVIVVDQGRTLIVDNGFTLNGTGLIATLDIAPTFSIFSI